MAPPCRASVLLVALCLQLAVATLNSSATLDSNSHIVEISITAADQDAVQRLRSVAFAQNQTFLTLSQAAIMDMFGLPVDAISPAYAMAPSVFNVDIVPPRLVAFTLDMTRLELALLFSESINTTTLRLSLLCLQSSAVASLATTRLCFTNASSLFSNTTVVADAVIFTIGEHDANLLKGIEGLAKSDSSTFLTAAEMFVRDVAQNFADPILPSQALRVNRYTRDAIPPTLLSFTFNITSGTLFLTFSESLQVASLQLGFLTLQSQPNSSTSSMQLSSGIVSNQNSPLVTITLSSADLNTLKSIPTLAKSRSTTHLSFLHQYFRGQLQVPTALDMSGNKLVEIPPERAMVATEYNEKRQGPRISGFDFSLANGTLLLSFDETINASSFSLTSLGLASSSTTVMLTGGRVSATPRLTEWAVILTDTDVDNLKMSAVCVVASECRLIYEASFVADMLGLPVQPRSINASALSPSTFVPDTERPFAVEFAAFNLTQGTGIIRFSEPITVQSPSSLYLGSLSSANRFQFSFQLSSNTSMITVARTVTFQLAVADLNELKFSSRLCTYQANCYVYLNSTFASDKSGNSLMPTVDVRRLLVSAFIADTVHPTLSSSSFSLDSGELLLSFSKPVNLALFNFSQMQLSDGLSSVLALPTNSAAQALGTTRVRIMLATLYLHQLKANLICVSPSTCNLCLREAAVADTTLGANFILPVCQPISNFGPDTTQPSVTLFSLDLQQYLLSITFSEPISYNQLSIASFVLAAHGSSVSLNNSSFEPSDHPFPLSIAVRIAFPDQQALKMTRTIGRSGNQTSLRFLPGAVFDVSQNAVALVDFFPASLVLLSTQTNLLSFELDLSRAMLQLTFSDLINSSSIGPAAITLQCQPRGGTLVTLSQGCLVEQLSAFSYSIALTSSDFNRLATGLPQCPTAQNAFLIVSQSFANDSFGRSIQAISDGGALLARAVTSDTRPPRLLQASLDLNLGKLVLFFSETVQPASFNFSGNLNILDSSCLTCPNTTRVSLSQGQATVNLSMVQLSLPLAQTNVLRGFSRFQSNSFVSFSRSLCTDMSANPIVATDGTAVMPQRASCMQRCNASAPHFIFQGVSACELACNSTFATLSECEQTCATVFANIQGYHEACLAGCSFYGFGQPVPASIVIDVTGPVLLAFSLNMNQSTISLTFDEPVQSGSLNLTLVTLQDSVGRHRGSLLRRLSGGQVLSGNGLVVEARLLEADVNEMKTQLGLAMGVDSTFVVLESGAVVDMSGNPSAAIGESSGLRASGYVADRVAPRLASAEVDMSAGTLVLEFSESVLASRLAVSGIVVQNGMDGGAGAGANASGLQWVRLDGGGVRNVSRANRPTVVVWLGVGDLNAIKVQRQLATSAQTTFVRMEAGSVEDTSGNGLVSGTVQVRAYTADRVAPRLVSFDLDMGHTPRQAQLRLTFDEPIDVASFNPDSLALIAPRSEVLRLTFAATSQSDGVAINVTLSVADSNVLKSWYVLNSSMDSRAQTRLQVSQETCFDTSNNSLTPSTLLVATVLSDGFPPSVVGFDLDLSASTIVLSFSETIKVDSFRMSALYLSGDCCSGLGVHLSGGTLITAAPTSTVIAAYLQVEDRHAIKLFSTVGRSNASTFLSFSSGLVRDTSGNVVVAVNRSASLSVSAYIADNVSPTIQAVILNLTAAELLVRFDEPVNVSTLLLTALSLSSGNLSRTVSLSSALPRSTQNGLDVVVYLSQAQVNELAHARVALSSSDTMVTISPSFVRDMFGNAVVSVAEAPLSGYYPDLNPPTLLSSSVNFNLSTLVLNFNKVVDSSTSVFHKVVLKSLLSNGVAFTLTSFTTISSQSHGTSVVLGMSLFDQGEIQLSDQICVAQSACFVELRPGFVMDLFFNGNQQQSQPISVVVPDQVPPRLLSFYFDQGRGSIAMLMSKPVRSSTLNVTGLLLKYSNASGGDDFLLSGGLVSTTSNGYLQTVRLTAEDLNRLKALPRMFTMVDNTYLVLRSATLRDMVGNANFEQQPIQATNVSLSSARPSLTNFTVNMSTGLLTLTFDETINASTLNPSSTCLHTAPSSLSPNLCLENSVATQTYPVFSTMAEILVTQRDLNELKRLRVGSTSSTWLSHTDGLVRNMNNVAVNDRSSPLLFLIARLWSPDEVAPHLVSFQLNMSNGLLILEFSETILASSFQIQSLTLQDSVSNPGLSFAFRVQPLFLVDSVRFNIALSAENLNELKKVVGLATRTSNTFLSISQQAATDMAAVGNVITPISVQSALAVSEFTRDVIAPVLVRFEIDLTLEMVWLTFDETVNVTSTVFGRVRVQNAGSGANESVVLSGGRVVGPNDVRVAVALSTADVNAVKRLRTLCRSAGSCFVSVGDGVVQDMSGNGAVGVSSGSGLMASGYEADRRRPRLVGFEVSMDGNGSIALTFDETVMASTLEAGALVAMDARDSGPGRRLQLGGGWYGTGAELDGTVLRLVPLKADMDALKVLTGIYVSANTSFVGVSGDVVQDMFGNRLEADVVGPARVFVQDTTAPVLVAFDLNMSALDLKLTFTEPIGTLINISCLTFSEQSSSLPLSPDSFAQVSTSRLVLTVSLSTTDANRMKDLYPLASSAQFSRVSLRPCFATDVATNSLVPVVDKLPAIFVADLVAPSLTRFGLNLTSQTLSLTFNEPINVSSVRPSEVTLFSRGANGVGYTLTDSVVHSSRSLSTIVDIRLSLSDLNALKATDVIARNASSLFLALTSSFATDKNANAITAIPSNESMIVSSFASDVVAPVVQSVAVDMNHGILIVDFSETVRASSVMTSLLAVQGTTGPGTVIISGAVVLSVNQPRVQLQLTDVSMHTIKLAPFAKSVSTCAVSLQQGAVQDMFGNPVATTFVNCSSFVADSNAPSLTAFDLAVDTGMLRLFFNETVDPTSLSVSSLALGASSQGPFQTLMSPFNVTFGVNSTTLVMTLNRNDVQQLKLAQIGMDQSSTWLSVARNFVFDTALAANGAVSGLIQVSQLQPSTSRASLSQFSWNMDSGALLLSFVDPINVSTANFTAVVLLNAANPSIRFRLPGASVPSQNGFSIVLNLAPAVLNDMKRNAGLCTNQFNCFVQLDEAFVIGMNGMFSLPAGAMGASSVFADTTAPKLSNFSIDMDSGTLVFSFTRTINASTFVSSLVTLQRFSSTAQGPLRWSLTSSFVPNPEPSTVISVRFTEFDLNQLKASEVCIAAGRCWLNLHWGAFKGMNGLFLAPQMNESTTFAPSAFVADVTLPQLRSFNVSMNAGVVTLSFTETVNTSTFVLSSLRLGSHAGDGAPLVLVNSTWTAALSPVLTLSLGHTDLNMLKAADSLFRADTNTFVSLLAGAIADVSGNTLALRSFVRVDSFVADTTVPHLVGFSLDENSVLVDAFNLNQTFTLTLSFSEAVRRSSLDVTSITLLSQRAALPSQWYTLTGLAVLLPAISSTEVSVKLLVADVQAIKLLSQLAKSPSSTFLALTSTAIADMAGNAVAAIANSAALSVSSFVPDQLSPTVINFAFDQNAGSITLQFDEPVNGSSLVPVAITLQNRVSRATVNLTLTGGLSASRVAWVSSSGGFGAPNGNFVTVLLTAVDLNRLKALHFCTRSDDCYLVHTRTLVRDIAGNAVNLCL